MGVPEGGEAAEAFKEVQLWLLRKRAEHFKLLQRFG